MQYPLIYEHNSVRVFKINDSVYYREGNLDERRQCNGGFVVLKDCTVAIDVPSEDGAREMLDESEKLFGLPIKHAFITHAHPDHDLGLPVFAEKGGITVYGAAAAPQEWAARGVTFPGNFIGISGRERVSIEGMDFELEKLPVTAAGVVCFVLVCLLLPLLIMSFTCLFAWVLALISARMRHKTVITLMLSLAFLGAYMYAAMNLQNYLTALLESSAQLAGSVEAYAFPAYALGVAAAEGNFTMLLGFAACCVVPFVIVCALLSRFFSSVTARRASVRIKYRRTQLKAAGAMSALLGKELRRFASNSMIILNSALGSVFLIVMGVAAIIYRDQLMATLGLLPGGMLAGMAVLALSFMGAMDYISAASISLEGKSLWIPKTIPVPVRTILMSKVLLNVVIALPATVIASVCVAIALPFTALERLLVVLIPALVAVFISLYGVVINLRFPKFDYINEVNVVKNSMSVVVCLFSSWGILAAPTLLYVFLLSDVVGMTAYLGICAALLLIACLLLYAKLGRSEERFMEL